MGDLTDLSSVRDDLLELIKEVDSEFPLCTADCLTWKLEHPDCRGCQHWPRCRDFVLGMEIGTTRVLKKLGIQQ